MAKEVVVPPLGQTTAEVTLVHWYKREGDAVQAGEPLYAIETDKAVLDVEAPASGVLRAVSAAEGQTVPVLQSIAVIAAPDEAADAPSAAPGALSPDTPAAAVPAVAPRPAASTPTFEPAPGASVPVAQPAFRTASADATIRRLISPRARRLAEAEGLDWSAVPASGPEGAIIERDVRAALEARDRLSASASASAAEPPALLMVEADMTQALHAVAQLRGSNHPLTITNLLERVVRHVGADDAGFRATLVHRPECVATVFAAPLVAGYSAALGVGRIAERPWTLGGQIVARPICWLALTYDAHTLSEAQANAWLGALQRLIEQPALLLV